MNDITAKLDYTTLKLTDKCAKAILQPVALALQSFCEQSDEFTRAVLDGGSLEDCISHAVKQIGSKQAVSDLDVFQSAVEFYFPGAVIECKMVLHMSRYETEEEPEQPKSIDLSLDSLLDW